MKRVKLWSVTKKEDGTVTVGDVPIAENTETEQIFESLLVDSPQLLMDGLSLIGRQVPTDGGPLDLIGVDQDGRLVVFELKRGSLTREAAAQILDYTSDIAAMELERFAKLIEDSSGRNGIDEIEDFLDWYSQMYPNRDSVLEETPSMVLVGLGADPRALRIINFLANTGIDISLLTFNAFKQGDSFFLARQIESIAAQRMTDGSQPPTKAGNLQALRRNAAELGVADFIEEVAKFVEKRIPAYMWPGKFNYSFSLNEYTDQGKPTLRVYVSISLVAKQPNMLNLVFQERAVELSGKLIEDLMQKFPKQCRINKRNQLEFLLSVEQWQETQEPLESLLTSMVDGWKNKISDDNQEGRDVASEEDE